MCDMEARLKDFVKLGVDIQPIGPQFTGWWSYLIEPELATAMARSDNLAALKIMQAYRDKFIGAALTALQDVEGPIRELEWTRPRFQNHGLDFSYPVREHRFGETLGSHRELWPFFRRAEEMEIPVLFHA